MSKELEALRILKANAILFDDGTDFGASMLEAISELDKSLTLLTAEELQTYKKIAKELIYMVDELNLSKCGENSKVRKKIREFKTLLGEEHER